MDSGDYCTDEQAETLGQGSYGVVLKGFNKSTNEPVAVKRLNKQDVFSESAGKELMGLKKLRGHQNVVALLDSHIDGTYFYLIMEFCDRGDLESYIKDAQPNLQQKLNIMSECASAINFMHNLKPPVIHRDLKLANILLKTVQDEEVTVKICDFGVAKIFDTSASDQMMKTDTGTMAFRAPEFFRKEEGKLMPYTSAVDVFSLGLVFQVVLNYGIEGKYLTPRPVGDTGAHYISYAMDMVFARERGTRYPILFTVRPGEAKPLPEIKAIVSRMTTYDPQDRMSIGRVEKEVVALTEARKRSGLISSSDDEPLTISDNIPKTALITILKQSKMFQQQYKNTKAALVFSGLFFVIYSVFVMIKYVYGKMGANSPQDILSWRISCVVTAWLIIIGITTAHNFILMTSYSLHIILMYAVPVLLIGSVIGIIYLTMYGDKHLKMQ